MSDGFAGEGTLHDVIVRYSPIVRAAARPFAHDGDDLEDLVQETWIRAYRKRHTWSGGSLLSWLLTICRNVCLANERSTSRRVHRDRVSLDDNPASDDVEMRIDARAALDRLASLPERQRDAITLRLIEGYSTRETALRMNCAEGTVKALLHQAIQSLKEHHANR